MRRDTVKKLRKALQAKFVQHWKTFGIVGLCFIAALGWLFVYVWRFEHRAPVLEVYFLNVTHGSAMFVRTPNGKTLLAANGIGGEIIQKLTEITPFYRRHIDVLIAPLTESTEEIDKSPGITDIQNRYSVSRIIYMGTSSKVSEMGEINLDEKDNKEIAVKILERKIIKISYGRSAVLFVDELSRKDQQQILETYKSTNENKNENILRADVLQLRSAATIKVSTNFFNAVHPNFVVVSKMPQKTPQTPRDSINRAATSTKPSRSKDEKFNLFSHPQTKHYALDREGTLKFISDGEKFRLEK